MNNRCWGVTPMSCRESNEIRCIERALKEDKFHQEFMEQNFNGTPKFAEHSLSEIWFENLHPSTAQSNNTQPEIVKTKNVSPEDNVVFVSISSQSVTIAPFFTVPFET